MTTFLENLDKSGNFFKSGESQEKQTKSGKSHGNHDCAILSASITNSNFTSNNTKNAHICIEFFNKFSRGHTAGPPLLRDGHLPGNPQTHPSSRFAARLRRYAPRLKAISISFIHSHPTGKVREFHLA